MTTALTITREDAEEFIRLHAQAALAEARMKVLREKILPALVAGAKSPTDLAFLLVNQPSDRPQKDWQGYVLRLLTVLLGRTKAAVEFKRIDGKWKKIKTPSLCVVKNLAYAAKVGEPAAAVPEAA